MSQPEKPQAPQETGDAMAPPEPDMSSLQELQQRLANEAARANADYDKAREDLAQHHDHMDAKTKRILAKVEELEPKVQAILEGGEDGLTPENEQILLDYVTANESLRKHRIARRMAWPATQKAGEHQPGKPLG